MFVQIHTLTGYAGVLLNRDDTGMAKRLTYGDAVRTRTSSQFAKRKIRTADGEHSLQSADIGVSVRSRETFKRLIAQPLVGAGYDKKAIVDTTLVLMDAVYKPSPKAEKSRKEKTAVVTKGDADAMSLLERGEINVLSQSEITYLRDLVESCLKDKGANGSAKAAMKLIADKEFLKNLRKAGESMSLDVAMFGRMVTGDALSSVSAAVHVAHGLTVHAQAVETDFFTAVDDLVTGDEDSGGGHLGEVEITSPMLYGYYVVDISQLASNLLGVDNAAEISAEMVGKLIRLVTEQVIGAKKGSTAPYSSSDFVMVEIGKGQPRTLAEAFRTPTKPNLVAAISALGGYLAGKDKMYAGSPLDRLVACAADVGEVFGVQMNVLELASAVATRVEPEVARIVIEITTKTASAKQAA
jgi:CRISPR system Cascade subunit CasC